MNSLIVSTVLFLGLLGLIYTVNYLLLLSGKPFPHIKVKG